MKFSKDYIINNANEALNKLEKYLNDCIAEDDSKLKKANLLSFWLKDYTDYLLAEEKFEPFKLKHYGRGDIIKANLGFNVGNEEGRTPLLYCFR